MQIRHYLPNFSLRAGGPPRSVINLAAGLNVRSVETTVICHRADVSSSDLRRCDAEIFPSIFSLLRSASTLFSAPGTVVHFHSVWSPRAALVAWRLSRFGTPYIVSPRGQLDDWSLKQKRWKKAVYWRLVGKRYLRAAAGVHCTTESEANQVESFSACKTEVIPNILDAWGSQRASSESPWEELLPKVNVRRRLLFLGRLHPKKQVEHVLRCLRSLENRGEAPGLIIAGEGDGAYVRFLRAEVSRLGIGHRVSFVGFVDGQRKLDLLTTAHVLCAPSLQENFGHVIYEALACGTIVATTQGVDGWEVLQNSGAVIVSRVDAMSFEAAVQEAIKQLDCAGQVAKLASDFVAAHLATPSLVERYIRYYGSVFTEY